MVVLTVFSRVIHSNTTLKHNMSVRQSINRKNRMGTRHERLRLRVDLQVNAFRVPHSAVAYLSAVSPSEGYGKLYTTFPRDNQRWQNPLATTKVSGRLQVSDNREEKEPAERIRIERATTLT